MSDTISINFSEEYRRTKRNVLFWATTTIVLVAGTLTSDLPIETSWAHNIKLPPMLLAVCSWLVMVFMSVDFWHANHRLQIDNNTLAATIVEKGTVKASSELARQLREIKADLEPIRLQLLAFALLSTNEEREPEVDKIQEQLGLLNERVEYASGLRESLEGFAKAVDKRDISVRKYYYVLLTVVMGIFATGAVLVRVLCPLDARQEIGHFLLLGGTYDQAAVANTDAPSGSDDIVTNLGPA